MTNITIGFALCGSFCTFEKAIQTLINLKSEGYNIIPIMSFNAFNIDTRFGKAIEFRKKIEKICENRIISSIPDAEPIGPKKMLDILIIEPCTGNTLAKLAAGIADTPVTLAVKSQLRNSRPVLISISTNDALSGAAKNIGKLQNYKNIYFVPYRQDDYKNKPTSIISDFSKTLSAAKSALKGEQLQPVLLDSE